MKETAPGNSPINSGEWWDSYFQQGWESHTGPQQTRHFMECLVANLDKNELSYLAASRLDILDWGCAMGEGAKLLADIFTRSNVAGLDFARTAVDRAKQQFPKQEFIWTADGAIPREFDVIVVSNTLEHFREPFKAMAQHLRHCRSLYLALVPYNEKNLRQDHFYSFSESSFPEEISGFRRLYGRVIDVHLLFWPGRQLLAAYGSEEYLKNRENLPEDNYTALSRAAAGILRAKIDTEIRLEQALAKLREKEDLVIELEGGGGMAGRMLLAYRRMKAKTIPLGSRRRRIYDWWLNLIKKIF